MKQAFEHPDRTGRTLVPQAHHINCILNSVHLVHVCSISAVCICLSAQGTAHNDVIRLSISPFDQQHGLLSATSTTTRRTCGVWSHNSSRLPEHFLRSPFIQPDLSCSLSRPGLCTVHSLAFVPANHSSETLSSTMVCVWWWWWWEVHQHHVIILGGYPVVGGL